MSLSLKQISHSYGPRAVLEEIGFEVQPGEFICLAGESGCGKSTLLHLIAGLDRPVTGSIRSGSDVLVSQDNFIPPEKRRIGLVFQQPSLFPHLRIWENVCFGMKPKSRDRARELLAQMQFSGRDEDYPHMLSGGQQQRVALARALAADPRLLLLDEPFASLDYDLRKQVRADIHAALKAASITTIMVTHDPQEALQLADRILLIGPGGKIEQSGTPQEIYQHPLTRYAARFFGHANLLEGTVIGAHFHIGDHSIALPKPYEQGDGWLVVRPERITFGRSSPLLGIVHNCRFSGSHQLIDLDWQGRMLKVKDYTLQNVSEGDSLGFSFDPAHLHVVLR